VRQSDQVLGQVLGLPTTMALFSFIGVAVTASTVLIYGEAIWDPVQLIGRLPSSGVVAFALFGLTLATLSTNLAANVVSPANDFANLWPSRIDFVRGGLITGVIGILIFPWRLYEDLTAYIFTWLIGYGALLGAIGGVMIVDYHLLRRRRLELGDLYRDTGRYTFGGSGFNWRALVALAVGIAPALPGFVARATGSTSGLAPLFEAFYTHTWFVAFFGAGLVHGLLSRLFPPPPDP
ncbi:MAG: cytosine permease, partial [Holophagales bacterium]|nr:cytosine permease [Holophagales bacterium]